MTIEGLLEFEAVRDFLYARMRGLRKTAAPAAASPAHAIEAPEAAALLRQAVEELHAARVALERRSGPEPSRGSRDV